MAKKSGSATDNGQVASRLGLTPVGFLLLVSRGLVVRHTLQTSQDHEHDDGQQRGEDGAHQVVAAAVLADVHQLGDGPADHIHPRDGGREEETCGD